MRNSALVNTSDGPCPTLNGTSHLLTSCFVRDEIARFERGTNKSMIRIVNIFHQFLNYNILNIYTCKILGIDIYFLVLEIGILANINKVIFNSDDENPYFG